MSKITGNATVYYGPNPSTYNPNGSILKSGDTVTALWKENNYVHIEYTVASKKKRGFVEAGLITVQENIYGITNARAKRFVAIDGSTYDGPGTNYADNKPLPKGKIVWFVGQKPNGYACIEYSVGPNDDKNKIRVYMIASKLSDSFTINGYQTFKKGATIPVGLPYERCTVSQGFNDQSTNFKGHLGYDIAASDDIKPIFNGTVVAVRNTNQDANGNVICIKHELQNVPTFYSVYCHLASVNVKENDVVTTSTVVGKKGGTGTGGKQQYTPHLHLGVFTANSVPKGSLFSVYGYCSGGAHTQRFEEIAKNNANDFYYGPESQGFERSGNFKFYDPYGVITSKGAVLNKL